MKNQNFGSFCHLKLKNVELRKPNTKILTLQPKILPWNNKIFKKINEFNDKNLKNQNFDQFCYLLTEKCWPETQFWPYNQIFDKNLTFLSKKFKI